MNLTILGKAPFTLGGQIVVNSSPATGITDTSGIAPTAATTNAGRERRIERAQEGQGCGRVGNLGARSFRGPPSRVGVCFAVRGAGPADIGRRRFVPRVQDLVELQLIAVQRGPQSRRASERFEVIGVTGCPLAKLRVRSIQYLPKGADIAILFYDKHHGRGGPDAPQWLAGLSQDDEFGVFDVADQDDLADERGWLYGMRPRHVAGHIPDLGTWGQQIAEFPSPAQRTLARISALAFG